MIIMEQKRKIVVSKFHQIKLSEPLSPGFIELLRNWTPLPREGRFSIIKG